MLHKYQQYQKEKIQFLQVAQRYNEVQGNVDYVEGHNVSPRSPRLRIGGFVYLPVARALV